MAMFIERLFNNDSAPVLEKVISFTAHRHRLLAENITNVDTPGYLQKDLDMPRFQAALAERIQGAGRGPLGSLRFDDIPEDVQHPTRGILTRDGNNRSVEQLMSDQARNGLLHNVAIELLRKQFQQLETALKERVV